jgi:tetratricopeptide (TPR) repeat protein
MPSHDFRRAARFAAVVLALGVPALSQAPAAPAPAPVKAPLPEYRRLFSQASEAYGTQNWAGCADKFAAAAQAGTSERQRARSFFAAAACATAKGEKDRAWGYLDKAAANGYRDLDRAESNPQLEPLRQDARWKPFLEGVRSRNAAYDAKVNQELRKIVEADQAARGGGPNANIDWKTVAAQDAEHRKRVLEIAEKGGLREAEDYFGAALVFQHGDKPEDYERAHQWCLKALELDPEHPTARWLAAATKDRYLMNTGKPQLYGTQFRRDEATGKWYLYDVDPSVTDDDRAAWDVPPLAAAKARVDQMNAEAAKKKE